MTTPTWYWIWMFGAQATAAIMSCAEAYLAARHGREAFPAQTQNKIVTVSLCWPFALTAIGSLALHKAVSVALLRPFTIAGKYARLRAHRKALAARERQRVLAASLDELVSEAEGHMQMGR